MLVSVGLLALLVLTLSLVFSQGLKALHVGYNRAEMYAGARASLDQMIREIPTAIVNAAGNYPFVGFAADNPAKIQGAESVGPELYFVGQVAGGGKSGVVEIGYWLRRTSAANPPPRELMRFYDTDARTGFELYSAAASNTADFSTGTSDLLAQNINDITITYYYHATSLDSWDTTANWDSRTNAVTNFDANGVDKNPDGLPNAVEVRITVQDKLLKEQPQSLSVFIPLEQ